MNNKKHRRGRTTIPRLKVGRLEFSDLGHLLPIKPHLLEVALGIAPSEAFVAMRQHMCTVAETVGALALYLGGVRTHASCESPYVSSGEALFHCYGTAAGRVHVEWVPQSRTLMITPGPNCGDIDRFVDATANDDRTPKVVNLDLGRLRDISASVAMVETLNVLKRTEPGEFEGVEIDQFLAELVRRRLASGDSTSFRESIFKGISDSNRLTRASKQRASSPGPVQNSSSKY